VYPCRATLTKCLPLPIAHACFQPATPRANCRRLAMPGSPASTGGYQDRVASPHLVTGDVDEIIAPRVVRLDELSDHAPFDSWHIPCYQQRRSTIGRYGPQPGLDAGQHLPVGIIGVEYHSISTSSHSTTPPFRRKVPDRVHSDFGAKPSSDFD
jgi:hypothetical protein